jgi:hypothetical protein
MKQAIVRRNILNEKVTSFVKDAEENGWRESLETHIPARFQEFVNNESCVNWKYFINSNTCGTILSIGSGWGTAACTYAKFCNNVYVIEEEWEQVHFLQIRKQQDAINNLFPVCTNLSEIPFPEDYFDVIFLPTIPEWYTQNHKKHSINNVNELMITIIYSLLKPGGSLYLPTGNLLNSFLQKKGSKKKSHIYSLNRYKKMFQKAGFKNIHVYMPVPEHSNYKYFVPIKHFSHITFWASQILYYRLLFSPTLLRVPFQLMIKIIKIFPLPIAKFLAPAFSIIGEKEIQTDEN